MIFGTLIQLCTLKEFYISPPTEIHLFLSFFLFFKIKMKWLIFLKNYGETFYSQNRCHTWILRLIFSYNRLFFATTSWTDPLSDVEVKNLLTFGCPSVTYLYEHDFYLIPRYCVTLERVVTEKLTLE